MKFNMGLLVQCSLYLLLCSFALCSVSQASENPAVTRFRKYLQIETAHPEPNYYPAAQYVEALGKEIGLQTECLELVPSKPLVVLTWPGKNPALLSIQLNSHMDVVPAEPTKWSYEPFAAVKDGKGDIYARGSQDMKCVGMQYLEAIRSLKQAGYEPLRTVHVTFVPEEEVGGEQGVGTFVQSQFFKDMNVGVLFDEGLASTTSDYRAFYGERSPWWLVIKASGAPGHGSRSFDNSAAENLLKSLEAIQRFRASQLDLVKAGLKNEGEVISVNTAFLKAGTPTPTGYVMNLQPSEASAGFDIRLHPLADPVSLERRIAEEWAPASRNMSYTFVHQVSTLDQNGRPAVTAVDASNRWWGLFETAVAASGHTLAAPEIFPAATDARFHRHLSIPAIGFSPMSNTPVLLHDHNEFLSEREFLEGIKVYEEIIKACGDFPGHETTPTSHTEL